MASPNYRNFNKFLDFKNRYIHIFWINLTNQQQLCLSKILSINPKINRIELPKIEFK